MATSTINNPMENVSNNLFVAFPGLTAQILSELKYPNQTYTTSSNAWLIGYITSNDGTFATVTVDDVAVAGFGNATGTVYVCIPVRRGSQIKTRDIDASKVSFNLKVYRSKQD